jgi:formylglycine-generating enzyme required for sulfatase activity
MTLRTSARLADAPLPLALVLLLTVSCAPDCPVGTTAHLDQCVVSLERTHACAVLPRAKEDRRGLGALHRVDVPGDRCYWIDRTEVTVEAYRRWLDETSSADVMWREDCRWKQARTDLPSTNPEAACDEPLSARDHDPFADHKPVRCVDYCDAAAFCEWADKRLCSDMVPGSGHPRGAPRDWFLACSNGAATVYPWGDDAADAECRLLEEGAVSCVARDGVCGPDVVGEAPGCSSRAGVVDLLGNVAEWSLGCVNTPVGAAPEPRGCLALGGSFEQPLQSCALQRVERSDARLRDVGFRCCADLTQAENVQMARAAGEP